ncbi:MULTISPECIES: DUF1289 domain-containing protein [unclassified Cupriavidus]|uniref:DUF1289 domain-containing protein n=1 Tax=unclassified Cupriavidus TaxID=2640874 RepID=UPI0028BCA742|nr:DUF1289 domain-containing protein [Cupriavidus sp. SZY C1]MDT6963373.1 DUF1289 domain-containing protein [Cupriavidus sp. SZY C1]
MTQSVPPRPANPCINICRMDAARRYCQGCGRTSTEIGLWDGMTDAQRAFVLAALPARRGRWAGPSGKP